MPKFEVTGIKEIVRVSKRNGREVLLKAGSFQIRASLPAATAQGSGLEDLKGAFQPLSVIGYPAASRAEGELFQWMIEEVHRGQA